MYTGATSMSTRVWITAGMTLLYVTALGCRLTGSLAHEWVGLVFCVLCILHLAINRFWYANMVRGKYSIRRYLNTSLNLLLPVAMVTLFATGIMSSRHVFGFLDLKGGMDIRELHSLAAYWGLVLLGMHTGVQWARVLVVLKVASVMPNRLTGARRFLAFLSATYGVWASFDRAMGSKLFLGFSFDYWDVDTPVFLFFTHNLAILTLYAVLTHYALKVIAKRVTCAPYGVAVENIRQ